MSLRNLFIASSIIGFIFGLGFYLAPAQTISPYGVEPPTQSTLYFIRFVGASFIGFSLLAWLVKDEPASDTRQKILLSYFVSYLLILIVMLIEQLTTPVGALVWVNIVIQALFTAGFGYFRFIKTS